MKKAILSCLVVLIATVSVMAQDDVVKKASDGFYGRLDLGYTMPHAANYYYSNGLSCTPLSGTQSFVLATGERTIDFSKASFSSGANVTIGGGYMFNPYIGVDLGIRVGAAPKKNTYTYEEADPNGVIGLDRVYNTYVKTPVYIMPSIILSTGNNAPFSAYIRAGIGLPVGGKLIENYTATDHLTNNVYEEDAEYDLFMSKALCGAFGLNYRVNNNFNIFGEINGMSLTNYAKGRTVTLATLNGVNELDTWTTSQQETEYHSGYTYDPLTQTATKASQSPGASMPGSNFGVSVGTTLTFADLGIKSVPDSNAGFTGRTYLRAGIDFSQPHAGNYFITDGYSSRPIAGTETYNVGGTTVIDLKKASYGSGLGVTVGGGYMFTPHFGLDLGINIGVAPTKNTYAYQEVDSNSTTTLEDVYTSYFRTPIYVTPSIVISTGYNSPFNVYARAGIVLPIGGTLITERTFTTPASTTMIDEQYKFGMSKGLMGALGVQQRVSSNFSVFGELSGMSLTRYAKSSEITRYTINGVDQLPLLTTPQSQAGYNSSYSVTPPIDVNAILQRPAFSMPSSTWRLQLGARFQF